MAKMIIIADDLTGACDSGVQLAKYGVDASVIFNYQYDILSDKEVIIIDTDSRSLPANEAYEKVKAAAEKLDKVRPDVFYKKIDSTMRGNIGKEINAIYDVYQPDIVIIAPGHPEKGRKTVDGYHYLNDLPLHETEVSKDPKTPVTTSFIPKLIETQTGRRVGQLTHEELYNGYETVKEKIQTYLSEGIRYLVCDAIEKEDFDLLVSFVKKVDKSVLWVGSAGLIEYLPKYFGFKENYGGLMIQKSSQPVLLVVGSISDIGRKQLKKLLQQEDVEGIELNSTLLVKGEAQRREVLDSLYKEASFHIANEKHVALYTSQNAQESQAAGQLSGYSPIQVSDIISASIGELAARVIQETQVDRLFLTGGDTANRVFQNLKVKAFRLLEEVEPGLPLGKLFDGKELYIVTKAGSFGNELAMVNSVLKLQGGDQKWLSHI